MRFSKFSGVGAILVVMLAAACDDRPNRTVNDPASQPTPQPAFNDPQPRAPNDPIANNHNAPQQPTFGTGPTQEPAPSHDPQKPLLGPSLTDDKSAAKTEKPLNDMQIVAVAMAANDGEVQMAEMAKKKATNADVKQFAALMYSHHSQGMQKTKTLATKSKLSEEESDLSQKLKSDVSTTMTTLRDKEGREFDKAYMESQVKAHKDVLAAMDTRLLPNAQHSELKTLLGEMRRQVADHLTKAQDIQGKLDKSVGAATPASDHEHGTAPAAKGKADTKKGEIKP